jgi:hypothetical protein
MGTADRRNVSMTALASVPRLNHGLPTLRRLGAISQIFAGLISRVTDAVLDEVREWQTRPLDPIYPSTGAGQDSR